MFTTKLVIASLAITFGTSSVQSGTVDICLEDGQSATKDVDLPASPDGGGEQADPSSAQGEKAPSIFDDDGAWGDDEMGPGVWKPGTPLQVSGKVKNEGGTIVGVPGDEDYEDDDGDGITEVMIRVPYWKKMWLIIVPGEYPIWGWRWVIMYKIKGPITVKAGPCD